MPCATYFTGFLFFFVGACDRGSLVTFPLRDEEEEEEEKKETKTHTFIASRIINSSPLETVIWSNGESLNRVSHRY